MCYLHKWKKTCETDRDNERKTEKEREKKKKFLKTIYDNKNNQRYISSDQAMNVYTFLKIM